MRYDYILYIFYDVLSDNYLKEFASLLFEISSFSIEASIKLMDIHHLVYYKYVFTINNKQKSRKRYLSAFCNSRTQDSRNIER